MKLINLLKKLMADLKAKLVSLWNELTSFDLQFSLDLKVINFIIGLFVSASPNLCIFWARNLFSAVFKFVSACFYFWDACEVDSFDMKILLLMFSSAFAEIGTKLLAFLFNAKSFKLLNERIANEFGYFEAEISVELRYRKWMRVILVTVLSINMPTILLFASLPIVPFKLPLTSRPFEPINYCYNFFIMTFGGTFYTAFELYICLVSLFIISKISVCNFYVEQIGKFEAPFDTDELQSSLITKCGVLYGKIVRLIDDAKLFFNFALLGQFLGTYASLLGCTHMLTREFNIIFFLGLCGSVAPLILTCVLSGLITAKCEDLSQSLYCSKWNEITDTAERKKILMLLRMTQRPQGFSIGGFALIGFELLATFMNQSYSYFNILREMS